MLTTVDETGRLNNYAVEPQMYLAAYPSPEQQATYKLQGAIAAGFIATLFLVASVVS